jgi:hypothetical protein
MNASPCQDSVSQNIGASTSPCSPALLRPRRFGQVCFIPETKDFYIAYDDHPEWSAHTVWGEVRRVPGAVAKQQVAYKKEAAQLAARWRGA